MKEGQSGRKINVRQAGNLLVAKVKLSTEKAVKKRPIAAGTKGSVSIRDYSMERQWKETHWGGSESESRRKEKVCKSRRLSLGAPFKGSFVPFSPAAAAEMANALAHGRSRD